MAAVKGGLAVVLALAAVHAYRAIGVHAADLPLPLKLALPAVMVVGALLSARSSLRNFQEGREIWYRRRNPDRDA